MITEVTKGQYLQLVGVLTIAKSHISALTDIEQAIKEMLNVQPDDYEVHGLGSPEHIGDALYSGYSAEVLLKELGIKRAAK